MRRTGTIFLRCEKLVPTFHKINVKDRYQILTSVKKWYHVITYEKLLSQITHVKNWYQILTRVKNWYQIVTDGKNWYLIVTDISDKTVKKWNRMQNAADLGGGVFYQCEKYACMLYEFDSRSHESIIYLLP